jgi:hypothetical protein
MDFNHHEESEILRDDGDREPMFKNTPPTNLPKLLAEECPRWLVPRRMQLRELMMPDILRHPVEAVAGSPGSSAGRQSRLQASSTGTPSGRSKLTGPANGHAHFSIFGPHRKIDENPCHRPFMTNRESSARAITHIAVQLVDFDALLMECLDRDQPARPVARTSTSFGSLTSD